MTCFDSLPQEIKLEIILHLDYRSLLCCASTCRSLHDTCKASSELQYIIELAMDSMEETSNNVPHSELLSRLRDLRVSWEDLDWKRHTKLMAEGDCLAYELVAGVFAMSNGEGLRLMWLPSSAVEGRNIERESLGIRVRDFAIDPTKDLITILEDDHIPMSFTASRHVRIHVRTVSTNEPHPLSAAPEGILSFNIPPDPEYGNAIFSAMLQTAYDIVALFITKGGLPFKSRLLIWNWRQGKLLYDSGSSLPTDIHDFSLLGRDSFILTSTHDAGLLHLYCFPVSSPNPPSPPFAPPTLAATLRLPRISANYRILKLAIHSGPFYAHPLPNAPFTTSQTNSRINVLSVVYTPNDRAGTRPVSYTLYVHNHTFLGYTTRHDSWTGFQNGGPDLDVDWHSWGEMKTRFVPSRTAMPWLRYVHGQRVVCCSSDSDLVDVLDFNYIKTIPSSASSNPASSSKPSKSSPRHHRRLCTDPSYLYPSYLFLDDIITRLPYYVTTRVLGQRQRFYACMIDEERIIGLEHGDDGMELHVYSF